MADETYAKMADVSNGGRRGRLATGYWSGYCYAKGKLISYFFPQIASYLHMTLQSAMCKRVLCGISFVNRCALYRCHH